MPEVTHMPSGDYPKPTPIHEIDLVATADKLVAQLPGHRRQAQNLAREAGVSVVMMAMEGGDAVQEHAADGPTTVHLLRGHVVVTADGAPHEVRPGQLLMFQGGVRHDVRAEEQSVLLVTVARG